MTKPGAWIASVCILLGGCASHVQRPYGHWELAHFRGVTLPAAGDIRHPERALNQVAYEQPFGKVWQAVIGLAMQGAGILALERAGPDGGRLLFVADVSRAFEPEYLSKVAAEKRLDQVESWLAIDVAMVATDLTRVTLAGIDPATGLPRNKASDSTADEAEQAARDIAREAASRFQVALGAQLRSAVMATRLLPLPAGETVSGGPRTVRERPANWAEYAEHHGNFASALARSQLYLVESQQLDRRLGAISRRILNAAGTPDLPIRVYVLAGDGGHLAFSLGNGDIFLSSQLLEPPYEVDHVAAVMAHEIDHVIQQDQIKRAERRAADLNRKMNWLVGSTAVVTTLVIADDPEIWFQSSDEFVPEVAAARLAGVAGIFGAMFASGIVTTEYGGYALGDYSRQQEFRADNNAAIYLWRAGFRPRAMREVLE